MPLPIPRPLSRYTRSASARKARATAPSPTSVLHPASYISYIRHLLERVRGPVPGASPGAVVGDAAQVSDRQRRRPAREAVGVAVVEAKWRPRRAAPSALDSVNASRANTWVGGGGGQSATPGGGCEAPGASPGGRSGLRSHSSSASVRVPTPILSHTRTKAVNLFFAALAALRLWRLLTVMAPLLRSPRPTRRTLRSVGACSPPVGVLHTACSLLLHCGDLAEKRPDLRRGRGGRGVRCLRP